jgi:Rod binding domain-containing protein
MRVAESASANAARTAIAPQARLVKAAHEFEAQLMKELVKPMISDDGLYDDGMDTGSSRIFGEFGAEALARAMSDQGGLGIAGGIVRSLSRPGNESWTETVRENQAAQAEPGMVRN